jgi:outer membrane protein TolC
MKKAIIFLIFLFPIALLAQQKLTLKIAIDSALINNYDIRIAKNNADIGSKSNTFGMAGGLPAINFSASDNQSSNNINQNLSNGTDISRNNVAGNSLNAGLAASITLFNGFKVIATKERLNYLQAQSQLLLNQEVQNTIAAVMTLYYDIVRQESYLKILQSSLDISNKKLEIITDRKNVGMANDADFLQAQIDVNISIQNINQQTLLIEQEKTDLQKLMGVKLFIPTAINDSILIDKSIKLDSITSYLVKNPQYLSFEQQVKINEQLVKEVASQRYPSVKLNTGYNFAHSNNGAGQILLNQSYGPYVGATLVIPLFNGNTYKTQQDVAVINLNNAQLQKESLLSNLTADAIKIYQSYSNTLQEIDFQQHNYELSEKLAKLVLAKFNVNQATILDLKSAQESFENSGYLLVNLQYAAKNAEIELKRLIYQLGN